MWVAIAFRVKKDLRDRVLKKAKDDGLTLKGVMTQLMQAYDQGILDVGVIKNLNRLRGTIKDADQSVESLR